MTLAPFLLFAVLRVCLSSSEFPLGLKSPHLLAPPPAITSMSSMAQKGKGKCKSVKPFESVPPSVSPSRKQHSVPFTCHGQEFSHVVTSVFKGD